MLWLPMMFLNSTPIHFGIRRESTDSSCQSGFLILIRVFIFFSVLSEFKWEAGKNDLIAFLWDYQEWSMRSLSHHVAPGRSTAHGGFYTTSHLCLSPFFLLQGVPLALCCFPALNPLAACECVMLEQDFINIYPLLANATFSFVRRGLWRDSAGGRAWLPAFSACSSLLLLWHDMWCREQLPSSIAATWAPRVLFFRLALHHPWPKVMLVKYPTVYYGLPASHFSLIRSFTYSSP